MTKQERRQKILEQIPHFRGMTQYYAYNFLGNKAYLTDGSHFLVNAAECHWLIDAILSHQVNPVIRNHPELRVLQFWSLTVKEDESAVLVCEWDKDEVVEMQGIDYTDFPLDYIQLYCGPTAEGYVIYLPSEY